MKKFLHFGWSVFISTSATFFHVKYDGKKKAHVLGGLGASFKVYYLAERISFFMDKYFKFWEKIEEIFPVDSTRLEPEPEKQFPPDPNPNFFFPQPEPDPKSSTRAILELFHRFFFMKREYCLFFFFRFEWKKTVNYSPSSRYFTTCTTVISGVFFFSTS